MTAHQEEQTGEIEALEAIYPNELEILSRDPSVKFSISVVATSTQENSPHDACDVRLVFTYTPNYPDELPLIEVEGDLEQAEADELLDTLENEANNNLGTVMIFNLVSVATEWLNCKMDDNIVKMKEEVQRKKAELEAEEMKRFEGTRVTVDTFLAWKAKFDAEMALLNHKQVTEDVGNKKLSGRELFEKDKSLNESDLSFLKDEGDIGIEGSVDVDESLFQDLEDLDFNED